MSKEWSGETNISTEQFKKKKESWLQGADGTKGGREVINRRRRKGRKILSA